MIVVPMSQMREMRSTCCWPTKSILPSKISCKEELMMSGERRVCDEVVTVMALTGVAVHSPALPLDLHL